MSNYYPTYEGVGGALPFGEMLSTAGSTILENQAFQTLRIKGELNGVFYKLPNPKPGVWYEFFFQGDAASSATYIGLSKSSGESTPYDIIVNATTGHAAACSTSEQGNIVRFTGISPTRYTVSQMPGSSDQWTTAVGS